MPSSAEGAQVRAARLAKGMSQRGLARAVGVSPATMSQIENGNTGLSVSRLNEIADALEVTVAQILDTAVVPDSVPALEIHEFEPTTDWREYPPLDFDLVLRSALDEFLAIGYHGATVRSIAARSGLSVPGIYHHYPSKQHMLVTILDHTMTDLLARAHAAQAQGRDAVERFSMLIENLALFHTHRRELGFVGASEMRSLGAESRQRIAELRTTQQRMIDHEVEQAVAEGRFRNDQPHDAARAAVTMCTALATWWRPDGAYCPEQIAEQYVAFALGLMGAR